MRLHRNREVAQREEDEEVEMRLKEAQLKALEEAMEENSAIQEAANDSQPCLWPVVVEQRETYPVPSLQAVTNGLRCSITSASPSTVILLFFKLNCTLSPMRESSNQSMLQSSALRYKLKLDFSF